MLKVQFLLFLLLFNSATLFADSFSKTATLEPILIQKGDKKPWCPVCGMSIKKFYKTSHISELPNHTKRQYCSLRCLAVDMQEYKIDTRSIEVVDAKSQKYIDASKAFYVVGSRVKGTMSKVSKLAFSSKKDAENFIKNHKGKIVDFNTALKMAQDSLSQDIAMIQTKKEKKIYPMGKNIFNKACTKDINPNDYLEINDLKSAIKTKKLCKPLKEKQLQALTLYLFEVKRFEDLKGLENSIKITKDEKCPICGMFVYKYPKWATQMFYGAKHYSFDGVKDMMKYYFNHKEGITKMLVLDYYSQKVIDAREAFYVIGSDVYGPMGNELIAFKNENEAKTFYIDHRAKKVVQFKNLTQESVYKLDD